LDKSTGIMKFLSVFVLFFIASKASANKCDGSCGQGEGDCDWNSDCLPGLICDWDWWWGTDYCEPGPDTVNFAWGPWGEFGECEGKCGEMGERIRHRPCIPPSNGGYPCPAEVDSELEECEMAPCPVHCEWGEWAVGECSTTCGEGMRTDVREQVVSAKNGGIECDGEASITEICHAGVDCPPPNNPKCNPLTWENYDVDCCSTDIPCGLGEGDCDTDDECAGDLVCGTNNCITQGTDFTGHADCCELPSTPGFGNPNCLPSAIPEFAITHKQRNKQLKECCSEEHPCGVGEGDCDRDNECEGELTCGKNNCAGFPSPKADCCE